MHRVDVAAAADRALAVMPDDVHEETLALVDEIAAVRELGAGRTTVADTVLSGRVWVAYVALAGLLVVLDAGLTV